MNTIENPNLLKGRMAALGIKQTYIAQKLGRSVEYVSLRVCKKAPFTTNEMYALAEILNIERGVLLDYFPFINYPKK